MTLQYNKVDYQDIDKRLLAIESEIEDITLIVSDNKSNSHIWQTNRTLLDLGADVSKKLNRFRRNIKYINKVKGD